MSDEISHSRRGFLRGRVRSGPTPLRPPWALPESGFLARCTRCRNCAIICPTQIIKLHDGYPQVDFSAAACTFCGECVRVCAPAALHREAESSSPWQARASVNEKCLAERGVECRICGEHCESDAIGFRHRVGAPPLPEIVAGSCTGCGACVGACPVKAIRVA